jgi:release factor glutamine methyltransferase
MRTILEVLKLTTDYLQQKQIESPRRQAEELLSEALGIGRMELYLDYSRPLTNQELDKCREWLKRRGQGEPLQYISGELDFFHCRIKVTPDVLIPRQETEILVDRVVQKLAGESLEGKVLWDICCGSGCIGIALKKRFPALRVVLSDICEKALSVAKANASANEVVVEYVKGDLLAPFHLQKAHYIVCNPPYISEKEYDGLDQEVRGHEPKKALVSGDSGLECYDKLSRELSEYLMPKGKVWFEIGDGQGEAIRNLFQAPCWQECTYEKDWSGRERFFSLEIE